MGVSFSSRARRARAPSGPQRRGERERAGRPRAASAFFCRLSRSGRRTLTFGPARRPAVRRPATPVHPGTPAPSAPSPGVPGVAGGEAGGVAQQRSRQRPSLDRAGGVVFLRTAITATPRRLLACSPLHALRGSFCWPSAGEKASDGERALCGKRCTPPPRGGPTKKKHARPPSPPPPRPLHRAHSPSHFPLHHPSPSPSPCPNRSSTSSACSTPT